MRISASLSLNWLPNIIKIENPTLRAFRKNIRRKIFHMTFPLTPIAFLSLLERDFKSKTGQLFKVNEKLFDEIKLLSN